MNGSREALRQLVQVARDGAEFYESALSELYDPALCALFVRMAATKRALMATLAAELERSGDTVPAGGTLVGSLQRLSAQLRLGLTRHARQRQTYIERLLAAEDRLLERLRRTLAGLQQPAIRRELASHLLSLHACHAEMRALQRRLAA